MSANPEEDSRECPTPVQVYQHGAFVLLSLDKPSEPKEKRGAKKKAATTTKQGARFGDKEKA